MTPNRLLLGLMVRGLKLPFPRQAGGKGHREHAQRAPKSHFPRQAEGNGHREGPKRRPASTDESPFWRPEASKTRVLSVQVPFSPCWSRKRARKLSSAVKSLISAKIAFSPSLSRKTLPRGKKKHKSRGHSGEGAEPRTPKREPWDDTLTGNLWHQRTR